MPRLPVSLWLPGGFVFQDRDSTVLSILMDVKLIATTASLLPSAPNEERQVKITTTEQTAPVLQINKHG